MATSRPPESAGRPPAESAGCSAVSAGSRSSAASAGGSSGNSFLAASAILAASADGSSSSLAASANETWQEKWCRLKGRWLPRFPWLGSTAAGVGCTACNRAGIPGPFGCFGLKTPIALQASHFQRHNLTRSHLVAMDQSPITPTTIDFQQALDAIAKQTFSYSGVHQLKLLYCLHEAMRSIDSSTFKLGNPITLFRDERKGRIAIRFRTCDQDLNIWCGTLGQERDVGTGAQNLVRATANIMRRACMQFASPPSSLARRYRNAQKPRLRRRVYETLRMNVITMVIDAAGDEVLASHMMRSSDLAKSTRAVTPNLLHIVRDKAHASRRLLSRPWQVDPVLKDVCNRTVRGRCSIARLVQNSGEVKRVFVKFAKAEQGQFLSRRIQNFRAAGHRFESFQKPLGRTCLHIHSVMRTALHFGPPPISRRARETRQRLFKVGHNRALCPYGNDVRRFR